VIAWLESMARSESRFYRMPRDSSQRHFYKISKHLIDKPNVAWWFATYNLGFVAVMVEWTWSNEENSLIAFMRRVVASTLALDGSGRRSIVSARPVHLSTNKQNFCSSGINIGEFFLFLMALLVVLWCILLQVSSVPPSVF